MSSASWTPSPLPRLRASAERFGQLFARHKVRIYRLQKENTTNRHVEDLLNDKLPLFFSGNPVERLKRRRWLPFQTFCIRNWREKEKPKIVFIVFAWLRQQVRGSELSNDVGTSQPPQATQPFRGGLKETNIPMMTLDMTTAFPAMASAFRPTTATTSTASPKVKRLAGRSSLRW